MPGGCLMALSSDDHTYTCTLFRPHENPLFFQRCGHGASGTQRVCGGSRAGPWLWQGAHRGPAEVGLQDGFSTALPSGNVQVIHNPHTWQWANSESEPQWNRRGPGDGRARGWRRGHCPRAPAQSPNPGDSGQAPASAVDARPKLSSRDTPLGRGSRVTCAASRSPSAGASGLEVRAPLLRSRCCVFTRRERPPRPARCTGRRPPAEGSSNPPASPQRGAGVDPASLGGTDVR